MKPAAPRLAGRAWRWMTKLAACPHPEAYFLRARSAPILILPWWMEKSLRGRVDASFQEDLIYATMNKYYFIRLLDDVMDSHSPDPLLLPSMGFFHSQFQRTYA